MFVCVCNAVTDQRIKTVVRDGAVSLQQVRRCTGLGSGCGCCIPEARRLIEETLAARAIKSTELGGTATAQREPLLLQESALLG